MRNGPTKDRKKEKKRPSSSSVLYVNKVTWDSEQVASHERIDFELGGKKDEISARAQEDLYATRSRLGLPPRRPAVQRCARSKTGQSRIHDVQVVRSGKPCGKSLEARAAAAAPVNEETGQGKDAEEPELQLRVAGKLEEPDRSPQAADSGCVEVVMTTVDDEDLEDGEIVD
ncbi:hypothetical protein HPB51_010228 [Rhipicephalus microplus]|uniref:Uncharacterized protein n=1 Tax=Rhipicephalus microplus TaxID=6941 RepID=A0A9J6F2W3_RHIMP|nr:hypothetical protein HPB51_010228 [Rhipicephalus microplus]